MSFKEYGSYDGIGLAELVRKKEITANELLDEAIERCEAVDPQINAVVVKHYDYARRQIENGLPSGPFSVMCSTSTSCLPVLNSAIRRNAPGSRSRRAGTGPP